MAGLVVGALALAALLIVPRLLPAGGPAVTATPTRPRATATATPTDSAMQTPAPTLSSVPPPLTPTPVVPTGPATPGDPTVPDVLSNTHVVVLASLPKNAVSLAGARARAVSLASGSGRTLLVLDSTNTLGMRPGYWAIVDGPHASQAEALAVCAAYPSATNGCYYRAIG